MVWQSGPRPITDGGTMKGGGGGVCVVYLSIQLVQHILSYLSFGTIELDNKYVFFCVCILYLHLVLFVHRVFFLYFVLLSVYIVCVCLIVCVLCLRFIWPIFASHFALQVPVSDGGELTLPASCQLRCPRCSLK